MEHTPKIAVVLVNYNGLEDTLECLASLRTQLDGSTWVVVVDNASSHGDLRLIDQDAQVKLIRNPINQGWSGGNNRGIECALADGADWVLLLNNDTVVSPELFMRLRAAIHHREHHVLGVIINEFDERDRVQTEGVRFNPPGQTGFFENIPLPQVRTDPPTITDVDIVNGCAVAIAADVFHKIGLIDERFFLICEESDFCLRAAEAGFRVGVLHETHVWHKHSVTFRRAGKPLQRYYGTRNLWLLLRKHPGGPGRRGPVASLLFYLRHSYHLLCHELEMENVVGAQAITIGISHAWLGRFGSRPIQPNWLSRTLFALARLLRRVKSLFSPQLSTATLPQTPSSPPPG